MKFGREHLIDYGLGCDTFEFLKIPKIYAIKLINSRKFTQFLFHYCNSNEFTKFLNTSKLPHHDTEIPQHFKSTKPQNYRFFMNDFF